MKPVTEAKEYLGRRRWWATVPLERSLPLRSNIVWTLAGNVIYAACQWGILTALAKLGSPMMVGQFALALAVTAPVIMFSNLELRRVQATDALGEYAFADYLGLRVTTTAGAIVAITGIALVSGYRGDTLWVILFLGLEKAFEAISDVIRGLFQKHERMDRVALSKVISGPVSLAMLALLVGLTGSLVYGTAGLALSRLVTLLTYDFGNARRLGSLGPRLAKETMWSLARLSLPLGVVAMLSSLGANLPKYFIERYWGESALGYYAGMAYALTALYTAESALGQSAMPRLAKHYAEGAASAFQRLLMRLVLFGALIGVLGVLVAMLFGGAILAKLYAPDYAEYSQVFVWLMIGGAVGSVGSFLHHGLMARRAFEQELLLYLILNAAIGVGCAALVPSRGLMGAAEARLLGRVAYTAVLAAANARLLRSLSLRGQRLGPR